MRNEVSRNNVITPSLSDVIIMSIKLPKNKETDDLRSTIKELGIGDCIETFNLGRIEKSFYPWGLQDKVGENIYVGSTDTDGKGSKISLNLHLYPSEMMENLDETQKAEKMFYKLFNEQSKASTERGNPKIRMILERKDAARTFRETKVDEDADLPQTAEYYQPLWLPRIYLDHWTRVSSHFSRGKGESVCVQQRLFKGNTDSGNIRIEILALELKYAKSLKTTKERFCAILALSEATSDNDMMDNEFPDELEKLLKRLATVWRNDLLLEDDCSLGIGLEDGNDEEVNNNGLSVSRALLYQFLEKMADDLDSTLRNIADDWEDKRSSKFKWKPATRRKRALGK